MKENIGHLITIEFTDRKETISGFIIDYSERWILLKLNPCDFLIDGYSIVKNKNIKSFIRTEREEFAEKIIRLKGLLSNFEHKIPLDNLSTILEYLTTNFGVFQVATKRESACYLGKLVTIDNEELIITFLNTRGKWSDEISFNPKKIRLIEFDTDYINSLKLIGDLEN
ncbi:hypothetical protein LZZ90_10845 [Flavobacterium sp. SM15]|uniref:hypothetical protein n=1 Tax=Flavobacterium sp. SM15 TaxID=2908005 RepID=UPI001EDB2EA6|nr:hypothetical protein [Flavobacterium sp. SM15]MCG2612004.1 hypothetical protein [Flavobacterium sp. SM15]